MKCTFLDFDKIKELTKDTNFNDDYVLKLEVTEDTQFVVDLNSLSNFSEICIDFTFNKSNINAHVIGIYSLKDDQKINTKLRAVHNVSNTSCMISVKGALYDNSFSYHLGEIYIGPKAFTTESYLNDHTLMLSDKCRTVSLPNLQIYNNDVKASHGASIGSVDSDKLYYLQSRGFDKDTAVDLLVTGFFESIFSEIIDENVANNVKHKMLTL